MSTAVLKEVCLTIDDDNFEKEVIESSKPVVMTFWAEWCGPCHIIAPIVEEIACEFSSKVKMGILDVDSNSSVAEKYRVRIFPTLLFFKDNSLIDAVTGIISKKELKEKIMMLL